MSRSLGALRGLSFHWARLILQSARRFGRPIGRGVVPSLIKAACNSRFRRGLQMAPNTALQRTHAAVLLQPVPRKLSSPGRRRAPLSLGPFGVFFTRILRIVLALSGVLVLGVPARADQKTTKKAMDQYEASHPGVMRVGGKVKAPVLTHRVEPDWLSIPEAKRKHHGPIIVQAIVSTAGAVVEPRVVSDPQPVLDPVVLAALRQWRYEPARKDGEAVAVFLVITVMF